MKALREGFRVLLDRRERWMLVWLFIALTLGSVLEMAGISLLLPLIAALVDTGALASLPWLSPLAPLMRAWPRQRFLLVVSVIMILVIVIKNLLQYLIGIRQKLFIIRGTNDTIKRLFRKYVLAPYETLLFLNSTEVIAVLNYHVVFSYRLLEQILMLGKDTLIILFIAVLMALIDLRLTLVMAVVSAVVLLLFARLLSPRFEETGRQTSQSDMRLFKLASQTVSSIKEVKVLGRESAFIAEYSHHCDHNSVLEKQKDIYGQLPAPLMEVIFALTALLVLLAVSATIPDPAAMLPQLSVLSLAILRLMPSVLRINGSIGRIAYYKPYLAKLRQELDRLAESRPDEALAGAPRGEALPFEREIRLEEVSFHYAGSDRQVIRGLDLTLRHGEWIGLTGSSGIGKTTLVDLLLGLLEPSEGRVLVDGTDMAEHSKPWGEQAGYVPQLILLMDDSIRANVQFGLGEAGDEEILRALETAGLTQLLEGLPEGLDTVIGEKGIRLSGGERQRVGIARAILRRPALLVLDEGTAALDEQMELQVLRAIAAQPYIKTCIVVAHRRSSLMICDRILHLGAEGIVEEVTHAS